MVLKNIMLNFVAEALLAELFSDPDQPQPVVKRDVSQGLYDHQQLCRRPCSSSRAHLSTVCSRRRSPTFTSRALEARAPSAALCHWEMAAPSSCCSASATKSACMTRTWRLRKLTGRRDLICSSQSAAVSSKTDNRPARRTACARALRDVVPERRCLLRRGPG